MSARSLHQAATAFIESRYCVHADANSPSWSPSMRASGPGSRASPSCSLAVPQDELADCSGRKRELRERRRRAAQDRALGVAEHALPRLLGVVVVGAGELDRDLEVLVVGLEERERRGALAQQVARRDGSRARLRPAAGTRSRAAPTPRASGRGRSARGSAAKSVAALERRALGALEQVAGVVSHGLDDAEEREELEVQADAQQPAGIGEVAALVDDVADQRAPVERRPCRRRSAAPDTTG